MEHYVNDYKVNNLKKIIESIENLRKDDLTVKEYQYITKKSPDKYSYLFRHYKSKEGLKIISNNEHEFLISLEDNLDDKVEDKLSSVPLPPPELPGENKSILSKINGFLSGLTNRNTNIVHPEGVIPEDDMMKAILEEVEKKIGNIYWRTKNYKSNWKDYSKAQIFSLGLVIEMKHKPIIEKIFKLIDKRIDGLLNETNLDIYTEMMNVSDLELNYISSSFEKESDDIYKNIRKLYKLKKSFFLDIKNIYSKSEITDEINNLDAKIELITQICIECNKKLQNDDLRSKEKEVVKKYVKNQEEV